MRICRRLLDLRTSAVSGILPRHTSDEMYSQLLDRGIRFDGDRLLSDILSGGEKRGRDSFRRDVGENAAEEKQNCFALCRPSKVLLHPPNYAALPKS